MRINYTAVKGVAYDGNETLASLASGLSSYPVNQLGSTANKASAWTAGNNGVVSQESANVIKLTNGAASYGYITRSITTVADNYYLLRLHIERSGSESVQVRAGTTLGGIDLGYSESTDSSATIDLIFKATGTTSFVSIRHNVSTIGLYSYWSKIEVIALDHIGVDETTQLQTNGTFTSNTTGWNVYSDSGTGVISSVAGQLLVDNNSSATYARSVQGITTVIGVAYKFSVDVIAADAGASGAQLRVTNDSNGGSGSGVLTLVNGGAGDTIELNFVATATTTYISLMVVSATTTHTATFDNARVSRSGNIISNASFGYDYGWTLGTGCTISGGVATHTGAVLGAIISGYNLDVIVGNSYVLTIDVSGVSGGGVVYLSTTGGAFRGETWTITANGTYSYTVTCTHVSTLYFVANNAISIDNVSVRLAVTDSSSNADGLEVYGEIVKVPVNYNSDTLAFANFSVYNYLKQPYNSNLDPGTGDLSFSCWAKQITISGDKIIIVRSDSVPAQRYYMYSASGTIRSYIDDDTTLRNVIAASELDADNWHQLAFVFDADNGSSQCALYSYIDGALSNSETYATLNTISNSNAELFIGIQSYLASPWLGYITNIKIDIGNAWTAQKILTDYNSEAVLFEQNKMFSIAGVAYDIDHAANDFAVPSLDDGDTAAQRNRPTALGGNTETVFIRNDKKTSVSIGPVKEAQQKYIEACLDALLEGQSFTFDYWGTVLGEDNPKIVELESDRYRGQRIGQSKYKNYSFSVIESD